eukprot:Mycagemm_TRINITY_DN10262_c0_g1::TRINITY_DN10262_c0_g1_i1::g.3635::m.3635 type:complete len:482 gc:universal TRINITY_DN10262_c0_g1_i1:80-1525(+)
MDSPVISNPIKELFKEFALINRKSVFADQARIEFPKGEANPFDLEILLTPTNGPFKEACVRFSIKLPPTYPKAAPTVKCLNRVFHPNVSSTGSVCFSMFSGDFNASYRLEHYINGLLWFLQNPNPDSALNSACSVKDPAEFEKAVRSAIAGLPTRGKVYDKIVVMDSSLPENILAQFFCEMSARNLGLRAMLDAYSGTMPSLTWLKLVKGTDFDAEVIKLIGVCSATVAVRARRLKVADTLVMKELALQVGDKYILVLTRGPLLLDFACIAKLFDAKPADVRLAPIADVNTKLKLNHRAIPAFGHAEGIFSATLVSSTVDAEPDAAIYTATGVPNLIMKTTFKHIKPFLVNARVGDFLQPAPPLSAPTIALVPAAAAAAVVAVPAAAVVAVPAPVATTPTTVVAAPAPTATAAVVAVVLPAATTTQPADVTTRLFTQVTLSAQTQMISLHSFTQPSPTAAAAADTLALARQQQRRALGVST